MGVEYMSNTFMGKNNKNRSNLIVLTYHKISCRSHFEKQIKYLIAKYDIGLNLKNGIEGKKRLVITSDDGDLSFYLNAFPILKKYKIPAVLFIIADLIDTSKPFWWDEIEYYLGKEAGNKKVWEVKNWPNKMRLEFLDDLRKKSTKPLLKQDQLTTAQLKEMQKAGIVIANHSHTHPMFDQCTREELEAEMVQSEKVLKESEFTFDMFAYPNGNYSPLTEDVLKMYGVKNAFLFDHKINKSSNYNPLRISRLVVNDSTPMWKFRLILSGWHSRILPLTRAIGKLRKQ